MKPRELIHRARSLARTLAPKRKPVFPVGTRIAKSALDSILVPNYTVNRHVVRLSREKLIATHRKSSFHSYTEIQKSLKHLRAINPEAAEKLENATPSELMALMKAGGNKIAVETGGGKMVEIILDKFSFKTEDFEKRTSNAGLRAITRTDPSTHESETYYTTEHGNFGHGKEVRIYWADNLQAAITDLALLHGIAIQRKKT